MNVDKILVGRTHLTMWDLGGDKGFRAVWERYYAEAHALVFVLDGTNRNRLEENVRELGQILRHSDLRDAPIMICVNKYDLPDPMPLDQIFLALNLHLFAPPPRVVSPTSPRPAPADSPSSPSLAPLMSSGSSSSSSSSSASPPPCGDSKEKENFVVVQPVRRPIQIMAVSAVTGEGIEALFSWLLDVVPKSVRAERLFALAHSNEYS
eukprot:TRINITY_DN5465_c0_g2_i3.p1 TRINITY_DN5465_c0_g2~~TRINITY_DN5465_c0_g2_i3.p1  ORF type:complete len:208 (-),score=33.97 TRINITY_DN5465_c0_g2_i3:244-867(-)